MIILGLHLSYASVLPVLSVLRQPSSSLTTSTGHNPVPVSNIEHITQTRCDTSGGQISASDSDDASSRASSPNPRAADDDGTSMAVHHPRSSLYYDDDEPRAQAPTIYVQPSPAPWELAGSSDTASDAESDFQPQSESASRRSPSPLPLPTPKRPRVAESLSLDIEEDIALEVL
jgi:hypothetical protein